MNLALAVASVTILGRSLLALNQDNLKGRLAFSTISQLSYIVSGSSVIDAKRHSWRSCSCHQPRGIEDHALLLRRLHLRLNA